MISWAIFLPFSPHQENVLISAPCCDLGTLKNGEKNQAFCQKLFVHSLGTFSIEILIILKQKQHREKIFLTF